MIANTDTGNDDLEGANWSGTRSGSLKDAKPLDEQGGSTSKFLPSDTGPLRAEAKVLWSQVVPASHALVFALVGLGRVSHRMVAGVGPPDRQQVPRGGVGKDTLDRVAAGLGGIFAAVPDPTAATVQTESDKAPSPPQCLHFGMSHLSWVGRSTRPLGSKLLQSQMKAETSP